MPSGDGTGPSGQGPMTGRGMGFCSGYNMPGFMNPRLRRGFGLGRGFGRGFGFRRRAFVAPAVAMQPVEVAEPVALTEAEEKKILEADLQDLKAEMEEIGKRLKELKE